MLENTATSFILSFNIPKKGNTNSCISLFYCQYILRQLNGSDFLFDYCSINQLYQSQLTGFITVKLPAFGLINSIPKPNPRKIKNTPIRVKAKGINF